MFERRLWALALLAVCTRAAALPADDAYLAAEKSCRALKADPARRNLRHHWLKAARRFEQVAAGSPRSLRAPQALLAAAQLLSELSRISGKEQDLEAAIADYQKVIDSYAKDPSSDASALALGRIYLERRSQPEAARRTVAAALARHPALELIAFLARLPKEPATSAPVKIAARGQRRSPAPDEGRPPAGQASTGTRSLLEAIARASAGPASDAARWRRASGRGQRLQMPRECRAGRHGK